VVPVYQFFKVQSVHTGLDTAYLLFSSAESKRHWPSLLQARNLDTGLACGVEERADALIDALPLLYEGRCGGMRHLVLNDAHLHSDKPNQINK
jgi:hypothetical protein